MPRQARRVLLPVRLALLRVPRPALLRVQVLLREQLVRLALRRQVLLVLRLLQGVLLPLLVPLVLR